MTNETANLTRRLADRLMATSVGELVSYQDLSEAIDQNVRAQGVRHLIYRAFSTVEAEAGAKFKSVHGKGYQRLRSDELHLIGKTTRRQIRRSARKASRGIDAGLRVANDLTPQQTNQLLREQSVLGLIEVAAKDSNLTQVPLTETRPLTAGQAARRFLDAIGAKQ